MRWWEIFGLVLILLRTGAIESAGARWFARAEWESGDLKRKTASECEELRRVNLGQYLHQLLIDVAEYLRNACRFDLDFLRPRAPP